MKQKYLILSLLLLLAAACVSTPPVQEMSDARLAISSAEDAGAERIATRQLQQAKQLLARAQQQLNQGDYSSARRYALDARDHAIRARERANAQPSSF